MPQFTFDMKLDAAFTVEATTPEAAEAMLKEILDCADINAGALPNGDPLVGEATLNGRAWLALIDGEEAPMPEFPSPLHYYAAAKADGWSEGDEDTPEEYCAAFLTEAEVRSASIASHQTAFRDWQDRIA